MSGTLVESHERTVRRALAELSPQARAIWRTRYLNDDGAELRAMAVLERAEAALRSQGHPTTIRTVWIALADRAAAGGEGDVRAAAALAGFALGLSGSG
jgi:hypothetical protein